MDLRETRRIFGRIGLSFALFIVVQQAVIMIVSALLSVTAPEITETDWFLWAVSYVPLYFIAFPVFLLLMRGVPDSSRSVGKPPEFSKMSAGLLAMFVAISFGIVYSVQMLTLLFNSIVEQVRGTGIENQLETVTSASNPWLNLFILTIVAPVMEEIIFRRMLYNKLIRFGGKTYIFVSALIFGLFHINVYQIIYAFLLGLLLAGIVYYSGTIKYAIILHMIVNFIGGGIGPLLIEYGSDLIVALYGFIVIALWLAGLVMAVAKGVKHKHGLVFTPGEEPAPSKSAVLLNGGMMFYILLCFALIVLSLVLL